MTERPEMLANVRAERVRQVAALSGRSARLRHGQFLVEGPGAVRELVSHAPHLLRDLYVAPAHDDDPAVLSARAAGLYVHRTTREVLDAMSGDAQGILAVARIPDPASLDVLDDARLAVLLPHASDPGNLGTMIRIADAAGADAVVVCAGSAEVTSPKVVRSTTGSLFHLPIVVGVALADAVDAARARGLAVIAADGGGTRDVLDAGPWLAAPTAWVFGNEAHGLSQRELDACDLAAFIPLYGRAESLNVAAAAAVCLYASAAAQNLAARPVRTST